MWKYLMMYVRLRTALKALKAAKPEILAAVRGTSAGPAVDELLAIAAELK